MIRRLLLLIPIVLTSYARFALEHAPAPVACDLITLDDVHSVLGASWTAGPASMNTNTDTFTSCYYVNGVGNIVAFTVVKAPKGGAKAELARRQANVAVKHPVVAIPDLCEGAMTEQLTASNVTLIAASGTWMVQVQVMVSNKPDVEAEKKLAAGACRRIKG